MRRKVWGWFGIIVGSGMLTVGCSLDAEPWPGWQGSGCNSDGACDDQNPCTKDRCDTYGACKHDDIDGEGPDDGLPCTRDLCVGGEESHPADEGAPCGFTGRAHCDAAAQCVGCEAATAIDDCGGAQYYCDMPVCRLKAVPGEPCEQDQGCTTSFCFAGSCCAKTCSGFCWSCNGTLTGDAPGTCAPILDGLASPLDGCDGGLACNGQGKCHGTLGLPCAASTDCGGGHCVDGVCCDSACDEPCVNCNLPGPPGQCTPFNANMDPEDECPGTTQCSGGPVCLLLVDGASCAASAECNSGYCVDGICCGTPCNGLCAACNQNVSFGSCAFLPSGQDPADECPGAQVCNGSGACQ